MPKIRKAVIPAAGLGTRFLPATKAQPKEMLPIVDKPTIQYIVEEAVKSGIEDIVIVTGRSKRAIEDHFDRSMELEMFLERSGKEDLLEMVKDIADLVNIQYVRQKEALGLGHAIHCAGRSIGNEPFAVLLGDDIIDSEQPCLAQMIEYYNEYGGNLIGVQQVALEEASKYGIITGNPLAPRLFKAESLVEKPSVEEITGTPLAIMGRYILNPEIFDILDEQTPGRGGEIQLTDAIQTLSQTQPIYAFAFAGKRYDVGDKLGFVRATVEFALRHGEIGDALMEYLCQLVHHYEKEGLDLNLMPYPQEKFRTLVSEMPAEKAQKIQ